MIMYQQVPHESKLVQKEEAEKNTETIIKDTQGCLLYIELDNGVSKLEIFQTNIGGGTWTKS